MSLLRVSSRKQPVQGSRPARARKLVDALQLPRLLGGRLDVQAPDRENRGSAAPELHRGRREPEGGGRRPGAHGEDGLTEEEGLAHGAAPPAGGSVPESQNKEALLFRFIFLSNHLQSCCCRATVRARRTDGSNVITLVQH